MQSLVTDEINEKYLNALIAGDRIHCTEIVRDLIKKEIQIPDLYLNLFQRSLYRTGELWEQNRVSVSVEHLATAITERLMALVEPKIFAGGFRRHSVIVACVADEYHQIGARMVADLFELVADVEDRGAFGRQLAQGFEQDVHLLRGEHLSLIHI